MSESSQAGSEQSFYDILVSFRRRFGVVTTIVLSPMLWAIYVTERYLTADDDPEIRTDGGVDNGRERLVVDTAKCEAPACDFVAVIEDPETVYDADKEMARHLNEDHDEIDRELAADYMGEWEYDDYRPRNAETGEAIDANDIE